MGVFTDHPHTAITETINNIIQSPHLDPEVELPSLLNIIKLQYSGPIEAARAIRKKLKYGVKKEQLRALDLLNVIVVNGGRDMTEIYNDRKLLQVLRDMAVNPELDKSIRVKVIKLATLWNEQFKGMKYYQGVAQLKGRIPDYQKIKRQNQQRQANIDFMNDEAIHDDNDDYTGPRSNADLNRKYKIPVINLTKESPRIKLLISESTTASINLTNSLRTLSPNQLPSTDAKTQANFDKARMIRRKILRYLQLVDSEEFLGALIHANEELVTALQLYSEHQQNGTADDDNSDDDYFNTDDEGERAYDSSSEEDDEESVVSDIVVNPRRVAPAVPQQNKRQNVDPNDPFGDGNAVDEAVQWK